MNVAQIYVQYKIPQNLQEHMLRVAALSQILTENWIGKLLDKEAILQTCLFHDMANIIKFNFNNPVFKMTPEEIRYWQAVRQELVKKYSNNIHAATLAICQEINLPETVLDLVNKLEWSNTPAILKNKDLESGITVYCDMRIGPFGIMSLNNRIADLQARNPSADYSQTKKDAVLLEKTLQEQISISVNSITDPQLNRLFDQLSRREV